MPDKLQTDWDPRAANVSLDQRAAYDEMRERCPVAYSELLQWSLFRHEDVAWVLSDPETFSNAVSQHVSIPNGMDPPEHTHYRRVIEPYFGPERIRAFEPACRRIAADLVQRPVAGGEVEVMHEIALPFAARVQCAFLGWPPELHEHLIRWTKRNFAATRTLDRQAMSEIAGELKGLVNDLVKTRLNDASLGALDVTAALMRERVRDQPLSDEQLASILRNWTVGEVGTISAAVGILMHLAANPEQLRLLRSDASRIPPAIDEILRIHGPLVANRRIARRAVEIGGRKLEAGARLTLMWIAANRDPRVFDDPNRFRLDRDSTKNLLFGQGIHACPAAPLARMELRVVIEELLKASSSIALALGKAPANAQYPASGFDELSLLIARTQ